MYLSLRNEQFFSFIFYRRIIKNNKDILSVRIKGNTLYLFNYLSDLLQTYIPFRTNGDISSPINFYPWKFLVTSTDPSLLIFS